MKKHIVILALLLVSVSGYSQMTRLFNQYYRFATATALDSNNYLTQNIWWYGPNGYRFSENGVKYSLKSYINTFGGGNFFKTNGNSQLSSDVIIQGNSDNYSLRLGYDDPYRLDEFSVTSFGSTTITSSNVQFNVNGATMDYAGSSFTYNSNGGNGNCSITVSDAVTLSGTNSGTLELTPIGHIFTDHRAVPGGLRYAADYSNQYENLSIPHVGYIASGMRTYSATQYFPAGMAQFTGAPTINDGVKWVFNPNNTNAGLNVGSNTNLPSSFTANGDIVYTTTGNDAMHFRINGETVKISAKATGTMMLNDIVGVTTTGVDPNAGGLKHGRVTTGSIAASSNAAVTLTWTTAFADTNYTVNCSVIEADTDDQTLSIDHIQSISTGSVVVRLINDDAGSAKTGTLHCIAMHD